MKFDPMTTMFGFSGERHNALTACATRASHNITSKIYQSIKVISFIKFATTLSHETYEFITANVSTTRLFLGNSVLMASNFHDLIALMASGEKIYATLGCFNR